jgi:hypothetical protein
MQLGLDHTGHLSIAEYEPFGRCTCGDLVVLAPSIGNMLTVQ